MNLNNLSKFINSKFKYYSGNNRKIFLSFLKSSSINTHVLGCGVRHCSTNAGVKLNKQSCDLRSYIGSYNVQSHHVLENSKSRYSVIDFRPPTDKELEDVEKQDFIEILQQINYSTLSFSEACELYKNISIYGGFKRRLLIVDDKLEELLNFLIVNMDRATDDELKELLIYLRYWPKIDGVTVERFAMFWRKIDSECDKRRSRWNIDKILLFIDVWFSVRMIRFSDFSYHSMMGLAKNPKRLSPSQLIQVIYYVHTMPNITKGFNMYNIDHRFEECCNSLSMEEITVALMGYGTASKAINNVSLLKFIMYKFIKQIDDLDVNLIGNILKVFRKSLKIELWPMVTQILRNLECKILQLDVTTASFIADFGTKSQTVHIGCLNNISNVLLSNLKTAKLTDIQRILYALILFNFNPSTKPCIFESIILEFQKPERKKELLTHPKSLVSLIYSLCIKSIYVDELIDKVLDINFVIDCFGKNKYLFPKELLYIDTCQELDNPNYTGNRLPKEIRNYLFKKNHFDLPSKDEKRMSRQSKFLYDIIDTAEVALGSDFMTLKYVLPTLKLPVIIFKRSAMNTPEIIPEDFLIIEDFSGLIYPQNDNSQWEVIVFGTYNMYIENTHEPNGYFLKNLNLLRKMGYKVHIMKQLSWYFEDTQKIGKFNELIKF